MEHADQQEDGHPEEGGQTAERVAVPVHGHQVVVVGRRWRHTQSVRRRRQGGSGGGGRPAGVG